MFLTRSHGDEREFGLKPMNCPGHVLLFGNRSSAPTASCRCGYAEVVAAPPQRARRDAPRPDERQAHHAGRRTHLLHPRADRGRDLRLPRLRGLPVRALRPGVPLRALDPAREQARHGRGMGLHRRRAEGGARPAGDRIRAQRGRRRVLRAEDRPAHDRLPRPGLADGHDPARSHMPQRFGLTYVGADNREHTPYVVHRALLRLARALHRHPDRALRRRVPVLARACAGAGHPGRRGPPRGRERARRADPVSGRGGRLRRDRRQAHPQRGGREDPLRRRLRRQGIRRRRWPSASVAESQSTKSLADLLAELGTL